MTGRERNGRAGTTAFQIMSINPADTDMIVGKVSKASAELTEEAVQSLAAWSRDDSEA